jgi:hypothetical protein
MVGSIHERVVVREPGTAILSQSLVLLFLGIYFLVLFLFMGFFDLPDYSGSAAGLGPLSSLHYDCANV